MLVTLNYIEAQESYNNKILLCFHAEYPQIGRLHDMKNDNNNYALPAWLATKNQDNQRLKNFSNTGSTSF
jgi:hypothetical protein